MRDVPERGPMRGRGVCAAYRRLLQLHGREQHHRDVGGEREDKLFFSVEAVLELIFVPLFVHLEEILREVEGVLDAHAAVAEGADRVFEEGARGRTVWHKAGVRLFDLREH